MPESSSLSVSPVQSRRRRRWGQALFFFSLLAVLSVGATPVVFAQIATNTPRCSGALCNGLDPYATHCAGQSWDQVWIVLTKPIKNTHGQQIGTAQLWWSQTCQTNWAKTVAQVSHVEIESELNVQWDTEWEYAQSGNPSTNSVISPQHYAPVALASAWGKIWPSNTASFTACATQIPPDYLCP